ncbi:carbohydrate binding domain-containing protein [Rugamonas aquatica]|uniref:CBM-cenC domain-containing protein n=1 Tax=Rugamonas aquatica TaxID=2743357 RepID=A0A6A7N749_9BURK|nr:hypothetical protein [Rugamonas aquatica]MQA40913.1 hypothetical protein [Rugamonas aquatica]
MRAPKLSSLALSLSLIFAGQAAQAQTDNPTVGEQESATGGSQREACPSSAICFKKRWIYVYANMGGLKAENDIYFQKLSYLINNAKRLGYTGIAITSKSFGALLAETPDNDHRYYQENFAALVELAKTKGVDLIPVGGTPDVPLIRNANLMEAFPVDKQPFVVNGQEARLQASAPTAPPIVSNGDFAAGDNQIWGVSPGNVAGTALTLKIVDDEGHDPKGTANNKSAKFMSTVAGSGTGYARLMQGFWKLKQHTAYRVSFWIKTSNFKQPIVVHATDLTGKNEIYYNYSYPTGYGTDSNGEWNPKANIVAGTQEWTRYDLDVNTLNYKGFQLLFTVPNGPSSDGAAWVDDVEIHEVGLPHPIRRTSLPVIVTSRDGATVYDEFDDYTVQPEKLVVVPTGRLQNGQELLVSSYQSSKHFTSAHTTPASACSDLYFDEQKAVYDKISKLFKYSSDFFIYHDEWRIMNWDKSCDTGTAGAYLARTTKRMLETVRAVKPDVATYIWNDMYDPYANAQKEYFAVNGDLTDVLNEKNGLGPTFTIMNWIQTNQPESLKYFSDMKFRQMVALYYADPSLKKTENWLDSLLTAEKNGVKNVDGFMYTTWSDLVNTDDYLKLQDVTKLMQSEKYKRFWPTKDDVVPPAQ